MSYKIVGVDESSKFPPRVETRLGDAFVSKTSPLYLETREASKYSRRPVVGYGNSYGVPQSVSGNVSPWGELLAAKDNASTYANRWANGAQMQDTASDAIGTARTWTANSASLVLIGDPINDAGWNQNDAQALDGFKLSLEALIATIRASGRIEHTGFTFSGTWGATPFNDAALSGGSVRDQGGSTTSAGTATVTFTGKATHYLTYAKTGNDGGTFTVTLDGVSVGGAWDTNSRGRATHNNAGRSWLPMVVPLPEMHTGQHTLTITRQTGSLLVGTILLAPSATPPMVVVQKAVRITDAAYTSFYGAGKIDNYRDMYNVAIEEVAAKFPVGAVAVADANRLAWNTSTHLASDGLHPSAAGNIKLRDAARIALGEILSISVAQV